MTLLPPAAVAGRWMDRLDAVDRAVYAAVAGTPSPGLDAALRRISAAANYSRLWMVVAAGLAVVGGRSGRRAAVRGLAAIAASSVVVNLVVKPLLVRERPDRPAGGVAPRRHVRMPQSASFPSGHAASALAFATAAGPGRPAVRLPLRALAAVVAYSRVHTGVHYPGDVVAGALVGVFIGSLVANRSNRRPVAAAARAAASRRPTRTTSPC